MHKRIVVSLFALAAIGALALVPAQESAAAGSLSVSMVCEPAFNGAFCEAYPFGSGFTYRWNLTGQLFASPPSSSAFQAIGCWGPNGGAVTVTVTAPNGSTGSTTRFIGCTGAF